MIENQRSKIRLGEISIVVASLLRATDARFSFCCIPEQRLLFDFLTSLENLDLTGELERQRPLHPRKRIHVLYFGFRAELRLSLLSRAHVCVYTEASSFHTHVAHIEVL